MNLTRNGEMRGSTFGIAVVGGTQTDLSRFEVIEIFTSCNHGDVKQHITVISKKRATVACGKKIVQMPSAS